MAANLVSVRFACRTLVRSKWIVLQYLQPVIVGVATGLLASWWATRLLTQFFYDIDPHEPFVWIGSVVVLLVVASLAAWLPASRDRCKPNGCPQNRVTGLLRDDSTGLP
jgi:hypothetical protein